MRAICPAHLNLLDPTTLILSIRQWSTNERSEHTSQIGFHSSKCYLHRSIWETSKLVFRSPRQDVSRVYIHLNIEMLMESVCIIFGRLQVPTESKSDRVNCHKARWLITAIKAALYRSTTPCALLKSRIHRAVSDVYRQQTQYNESEVRAVGIISFDKDPSRNPKSARDAKQALRLLLSALKPRQLLLAVKRNPSLIQSVYIIIQM
jgi:hypothetical protein